MKVLKVKPSSAQQIEILEKEVHLAELHVLAFNCLLEKLYCAKEGDEILEITTKEEVSKLIADYEEQYFRKYNKLEKLLSKKFEKEFSTHMEFIHDVFFGEQEAEKQSLEKQAAEIQSAENPPTNKILNNKVLSNKILNNNTTTDRASKEPATSQTEKSPNKTIKLKNKTIINKTKI